MVNQKFQFEIRQTFNKGTKQHEFGCIFADVLLSDVVLDIVLDRGRCAPVFFCLVVHAMNFWIRQMFSIWVMAESRVLNSIEQNTLNVFPLPCIS